MGIQSVPAASTASAPFVGAGSIVANVVNDNGFYTTSLAAGNYVITCQFNQQSNQYNDGNQSDTRAGWGYSAYQSSRFGSELRTGEAVLIKLTTTTTLWMNTPFVHRGNHSIFYDWYYSNGNSIRTGCNVNYADPTKPMTVANHSDRPRALALPDIANAVNPHVNKNEDNRRTTYVAGAAANNAQPQFGYLQGYYYLTQASGTNSSGYINYSTDCVTWTGLAITGMSGAVTDFAYGTHNQYRLAVSKGSTTTDSIASSTNGTTWTTRTGAVAAALYGCTAGNGVFVAVGATPASGGAVIQTSTDSITWSQRTSPFSNASAVTLFSVAYNPTTGIYFANANFYDTTNGGQACTSTNGTTWTICTPKFGAAGEGSQVLFGQDWTGQTSMNVNDANDFGQYREKIFVGGGYFWRNLDTAALAASTNGVIWHLHQLGYGAGYAIGGWAWYHPTRGIEWHHRQASYAGTWNAPTAQYTIYNNTTA
jgi:hypothetical protein